MRQGKIKSNRFYLGKVHVHLKNCDQTEMRQIAGMLRGLQCAVEGWKNLSGQTNDNFIDQVLNRGRVTIELDSAYNARKFKEITDKYFRDDCRRKLKVKRVYKNSRHDI